MKSDIEIARSIELKKIKQVAESIGIPREEVENYGRYIAKIPEQLIDEEKVKKSNLILVTAITVDGPLKAVFFLLFLFAVGYKVGPQFFRGLKKDGF